ncbi:hydantoinase/oxoprolinase family protein [Paraburkholderia sp. A2WS-5]|uniref:hydantoinase/oxoprolinase family protein n=1 Tax=unclassified Paraburkholderia TaxID=2615204 RepID=UPI003B7C2D7C
MLDDLVIGWDIGGAHVKAARVEHGCVVEVVQWPCPLWQGLAQLDAVLAQAAARWPDYREAGHSVTMTGEMADLFEHREAGVAALAQRLAARLGERVVFYAGEGRWCALDEVAAHWTDIASANWLATAQVVARRLPDAVLVDIGSTTTDLIPVRGGRVAARGTDDAARLRTGELVYQGVVRTPLCALAQRIGFRGETWNVMNELFATTADVYRLTGELAPMHDQHPAADGAGKDAVATHRRLARMIGHDARDASESEWIAFACQWRDLQLGYLAANLTRMLGKVGPARGAVRLVAAGCGAFLVEALAHSCGYETVRFGKLIEAHGGAAGWAQVCAPSAAVALLFAETADAALA